MRGKGKSFSPSCIGQWPTWEIVLRPQIPL